MPTATTHTDMSAKRKAVQVGQKGGASGSDTKLHVQHQNSVVLQQLGHETLTTQHLQLDKGCVDRSC